MKSGEAVSGEKRWSVSVRSVVVVVGGGGGGWWRLRNSLGGGGGGWWRLRNSLAARGSVVVVVVGGD